MWGKAEHPTGAKHEIQTWLNFRDWSWGLLVCFRTWEKGDRNFTTNLMDKIQYDSKYGKWCSICLLTHIFLDWNCFILFFSYKKRVLRKV